MSVVDCTCDCDRCKSRTKKTYDLPASCTNCGAKFTARMRKGDTKPSAVECPRCGVYRRPWWGTAR